MLSLDVGLVGKAFSSTWGPLWPGVPCRPPAAAATRHETPVGRAPLLSEWYRFPAHLSPPPTKTGLREAAPWSWGQLCLKRGSQSLEGRGGYQGGERATAHQEHLECRAWMVPAARGTVLGAAPAPMNLGVCCPRLSVGPGPAREEHQGVRVTGDPWPERP